MVENLVCNGCGASLPLPDDKGHVICPSCGRAQIIASEATAHEMTEVPPSMLHALNSAPGEVGALFRHFFGAFDFDGIDVRMPTRTFRGRLEAVWSS